MVTFELANFLVKAGAKVTVYTYIALDPARELFKKSGIKVITPKDNHKFSLADFDYVWVHSLTLPRTLLDDLKTPHDKYPAFVFLHMSALETIPDEHPWIYDLEKKLSSLSLYISDGALNSNKKYGLPKNIAYFRNPAPPEFYEKRRTHLPEKPSKILIVSNHPPKEVIELKEILAKRGIEVSNYGEGQEKYSLITPAVLAKYDAVITIGKTAQYCLVNNTPVYIYDWYGGPGWLTQKNYEATKSFHFSGRFTSQKTSAAIADELVNGYKDAAEFQTASLDEFTEDFLLDKVLNKLLILLKAKNIGVVDSEYIESVKSAELCSEIRFTASEELGELRARASTLVGDLKHYKNELGAVTSAKSYRLMLFCLKPYTKLRAFFRKKA